MTILQDQTRNAQGETPEQELVRLRAENEKLKAKRSTIVCKVSVKGALSVYGMGRFPVTLYRGQWERLLSDPVRDTIRGFISANGDKLKSKED